MKKAAVSPAMNQCDQECDLHQVAMDSKSQSRMGANQTDVEQNIVLSKQLNERLIMPITLLTLCV